LILEYKHGRGVHTKRELVSYWVYDTTSAAKRGEWAWLFLFSPPPLHPNLPRLHLVPLDPFLQRSLLLLFLLLMTFALGVVYLLKRGERERRKLVRSDTRGEESMARRTD